jgi:hypothetical protein
MNERIQELADEARIKFSSHWAHEGVDTAVITRRDLKEFAELIVRECAEVIAPMGDWCGGHGEPSMPSTMECAKRLKEHFGVEE